jgi:hypothetical protein
LNLIGVAIALLVIGAGLRRLWYHEVDLEGRAAQERIATLVSVPSSLVDSSSARFRGVARLLKGGPLYCRFDGEGGAFDALQRHRELTVSPARPIIDRPSAPDWWPPPTAAGPPAFDCYDSTSMTVWVRKTDGVCFVFISGG